MGACAVSYWCESVTEPVTACHSLSQPVTEQKLCFQKTRAAVSRRRPRVPPWEREELWASQNVRVLLNR
eukprot:274594-Prorocentrum_minimum.AAC.2